MSDHGGHDRTHGTDLSEDMTVPLFFYGSDFEAGKILPDGISLLDIAPTIARIMNIEPEAEWEGKSVF
jgi:arylsulfatase A-like enzyme